MKTKLLINIIYCFVIFDLGQAYSSYNDDKIIRNYLIKSERPTNHALVARKLVHKANWASAGTISTTPEIKGFPMVNIISIADSGKGEKSTGNIYFLLTDLDFTEQDIDKNNKLTFMISDDENLECTASNVDPMEPTCSRVIISGQVSYLQKNEKEFEFAKRSFLSRHPAGENWNKTHSFVLCKLDISNIFVLDWYGGPHNVKPEDYYNENFDKISPPTDHAIVARKLVHKANWASAGTISSTTEIQGFPMVNIISIADSGKDEKSTGNIYFLLTSLDFTEKDINKNNKLTFMISNDEDFACTKLNIDPMEPTCPRVIISGKVIYLEKNTPEYKFGNASFISRHPAGIKWNEAHSFVLCKLMISNIFVLDWYGGPHNVKIEDYYNADLPNDYALSEKTIKMGKGGNPIWFIFWVLVFWFISLVVSFFCSMFYVPVHVLSVCIPPLKGLADLLLSGIQFPHYCAESFMMCRSPF